LLLRVPLEQQPPTQPSHNYTNISHRNQHLTQQPMSARMALGGGSLRDRTSDFTAIAARLQKGVPGPEPASAPASGLHAATKQAVLQQSEFARKASQIGLSIHKTSAKLQKLAALAKRTSMFDDPTLEIDELTGIIKQDIQGLNLAIADLQRVSGKADANRQAADHSHTVVDNLRSRLKDATQSFKDVLTLRTENLKVCRPVACGRAVGARAGAPSMHACVHRAERACQARRQLAAAAGPGGARAAASQRASAGRARVPR
jgi:syntaxin 5